MPAAPIRSCTTPLRKPAKLTNGMSETRSYNETLRAGSLPGVGIFFVRGGELRPAAGFKTIWKTASRKSRHSARGERTPRDLHVDAVGHAGREGAIQRRPHLIDSLDRLAGAAVNPCITMS